VVKQNSPLEMKEGVYTVFHTMDASHKHELSVLDASFLDPDSPSNGVSAMLRGLTSEDIRKLSAWLSALVDNLQPQIPGL